QPARGRARAHVLAIARQHALEEAAQLAAGVFPGGAFVGDIGLEHRDRARLGAVAAVLDRADDGGRETGRASVQEAAQLELRADALLEAAELLEQVAIAIT